ncbi:ABC transporter substrate-binding protein [Pararhodobacter sp. SW119]|uniref:ABC transporter substrate-binding protein n=1 Tax=Pararhodobacter sp. SW119 TaxID=2780075 RepID=UPI001ADFD780|nr:ABC transporter substrate-binding protein [Pararhodobacter sp. SW119]
MRTLLLALAATALAGGALAQSGPLVIYTSTPSDQMDQLVTRFNETHPDIQVDYFRSGTTEVMNRLEAEFAAGNPQPDVLLIADTVVMEGLKAEDRLLPFPDAVTDGTDPALHDADGTYFSTKLITTGFAYNTERVTDPATTWAELSDPTIASRLTMASPLYSGAAMIHVGTLAATDGFGWDYVEALATGGALAGRGNGGVLSAVATGEADYGIIVDFMPLNAAADGSPIAFVFPDEGVTAVTEPVAILSTAANVEAAQAFVNWQLSEEGQRFAVEQGYLPLRADVGRPASFPDTEFRVIQADPALLLEQSEDIKRRFAELFGG